MARKKIQGPLLSHLLEWPQGVRSRELVEVTKASSSSVSGALNRLKGNGVIEKKGEFWKIKDWDEARWLTNHTYHTKNREAGTLIQGSGQALEGRNIPSANGALRMGDLFELIGHLRDGSQLVRTLDTGIVYKLEEV